MPESRRVHVDPWLCEVHALRLELAPSAFDLGDDVAMCDEASRESPIPQPDPGRSTR
jgi:ferredoxin